MKVSCPSCQRTVKLGEKAEQKYAGRTIACPNCSEMIAIPELPDAVESHKSEDVPPVAKQPDGPKPPTGRRKPPPAAPARPKPPRARRASPVESASVESVPTKSAPVESTIGPAIQAETQKTAASRIRPKRKSKLPLLLGVGGAIAVLAIVAVVGILLTGGGGSEPGGGGSTAANGDRAPQRRPAGPRGSVEFQLGDAQPSEIGVLVDGKRITLPRTGPARVEVAAGSRRAVLQRRGYQQVDMQFVVPEGDCVVCTPEWKRLLLDDFAGAIPAGSGQAVFESSASRGFDRWVQDFEAAKHLASQEKKDILIFFGGSDWCERSVQMANHVLLQPRFHEATQMHYVPVFIDMPNGAAAMARVQDMERNARLFTLFGGPEMPKVAVTDSDGLPYGWVDHSIEIEPFLRNLDAQRERRTKRDSLLMDVSLSKGREKAAKAMQLFTMLGELSVLPFYLSEFGDWYVEARTNDPKNESGELETFFEILWFAQLSNEVRTPTSNLGPLLQQLDSWGAAHGFNDHDRAIRLYFQAAYLSRGAPELMRKLAIKGSKYEATDRALAPRQQFLQAVAGELSVVSVGSGFAVAPDGYVLTNHHVVESIDQDGVRLTVQGVAGHDPLQAEVVATNPDRDLALIRLVDSKNVSLSPLPVSGTALARGQSVAAFGYPLGEAIGKGVQWSTGTVSATQNQTNNGMVLLDCLINPGNSGGPICGKNGQVVGIVAAKSVSTGEVDSVGMAVPGDQIVAFLQEHIPGFAHADPEVAAGAADWAVVDRRVSPSVVMLRLTYDPE